MAGNPLSRGQWDSVTVPALVMDGGASPEWAHNAVQALVDILPNARRRTLEGQTHGAAPEVLAPVLEEFFAGQGLGTGAARSTDQREQPRNG